MHCHAQPIFSFSLFSAADVRHDGIHKEEDEAEPGGGGSGGGGAGESQPAGEASQQEIEAGSGGGGSGGAAGESQPAGDTSYQETKAGSGGEGYREEEEPELLGGRDEESGAGGNVPENAKEKRGEGESQPAGEREEEEGECDDCEDSEECGECEECEECDEREDGGAGDE